MNGFAVKKISLNVLQTHYMIFVPRNNKVNDIHLYMDNVPIERDYVTIFILDYWMMFS